MENILHKNHTIILTDEYKEREPKARALYILSAHLPRKVSKRTIGFSHSVCIFLLLHC